MAEMKAQVKWAGDMTFIGHGENAPHGLVMDAGKAGGGLGIGSSPMEMLLMASGGCASIDVVSILQKGKQQISGCDVEITGQRRDEMPRIFTAIHLHFIVTGKDLIEKRVKQAVDLSMEKYCSVSLTLGKGVDMSFDFEVKEA
jgi:putative redox protein